MEQVILVDENDSQTGVGEKLETHRKGVRHRAFSIFVFNSKGEALLQKRAKGKYHSAGLWANTCCGHPRPGENLLEAARRRLLEEMGFECELKEVGVFPYRAELDNGLTENEIDHIVVGSHDGEPTPDPSEAESYEWVPKGEIAKRITDAPEHYAVWFKLIWADRASTGLSKA